MHEYTLMQGIINSILARTSQEEPPLAVAEVILEVGLLSIHSEAAARQAFEILVQGTSLENSRLKLIIIPPSLECPACGYAETYPLDHWHAHDPLPGEPCPRCGGWAKISGGQGVESIQLILAEPGEAR
ncbi:MAG: hydrogenase maturation nickel metallochaperone HypA [Thermodesulfobacteriota bacterium]